MSLPNDLKTVIQGEVLEDEETLDKYSTDASIFNIKPKAVVFPKDSSDIKNLVKFANDHPDVSLTPRSAGTDMSGGAINDSILMDMTKYFNKIIEIGEDFGLTQPGVYYRDFEIETLKKGLIFPSYPASKMLCTVGGIASNNSAGEKTLSYGQTKDYVESLKIIFSDGNEYEIKSLSKEELDKKIQQNNFEGEIYKRIFELIEENKDIIEKSKPTVHKNSAGYYLWDVYDGNTFNLNKLIVGSQGTLGVITEIKFKLVKPKPQSSLLVIYLNNLQNLDQIVNEVLRFSPEAFECYDDQTVHYAVSFLKDMLVDFKLNSPTAIYLHFLPEIIQNFFNQLPKLVLLANFTGDTTEEVVNASKKAQDAIKQFNLKTKICNNPQEAEKFWVIRHESFNLLRHHANHMRTAPFIDDIIVRPEKLPEFLPKLKTIMEKYKGSMLYTLAGHIGDGNFHIIPLVDMTKEETRGAIIQLMEEVNELVIQFKGSLTAEHNDGLIRGPFLPEVFGEDMFQLFKEVKEIFDPKNIFNPHKKTDATMNYSLGHLSKT